MLILFGSIHSSSVGRSLLVLSGDTGTIAVFANLNSYCNSFSSVTVLFLTNSRAAAKESSSSSSRESCSSPFSTVVFIFTGSSFSENIYVSFTSIHRQFKSSSLILFPCRLHFHLAKLTAHLGPCCCTCVHESSLDAILSLIAKTLQHLGAHLLDQLHRIVRIAAAQHLDVDHCLSEGH